MAWIVVVLFVVLLTVIVYKNVDRETGRSLKFLGKILTGVVVLIVLVSLLSIASH